MNQTTSPASTAAVVCGPTARARDIVHRLSAVVLGDGDRAVDRGNALIAFMVRVASAAILLISQVALARWMGAAEYGTYIYAWTLLLVLGGIATVGLNVGAIRIVSELREQSALDALRGFLRSSRLLVLAIGAIIAGLASIATYSLAARLPDGPWVAVAVALIAIPAYALTDIQDGICRGCARIVSALVAPYIVRPLLILGGIGLVQYLGLPLNAVVAAIAAVIATWVAWAIQTVVVTRELRTIVPPGPRVYRTRAWAKTTAPLLLMGVFDLAMQHIDIIVISNLLSAAQAGVYFASAKTMALILFVHYAVGSAMANRFAAISTRGDTEALRASVRDAVRLTFWPSLTMTVVMLAAGRPLLSLFGPEFVDGYPVMCVLSVAIMARAAIGPAEALLTMSGGQTDCARSLMVAALANLVLNLLLAPLFGIMGAAVAVGTAMILGAFLNWRSAKRRFGFDIGIWALHRP